VVKLTKIRIIFESQLEKHSLQISSLSELEYHKQYNKEFHKLAKMNLTDIKRYVYSNYPKAKADFFMKYKLPQHTIFLSNTEAHI